MAKKGKTERKGVRNPKNPREASAEALAVLRTVVEHIEEALEAYRAHKLPKPIAGDDVEACAAARGQRVLRLAVVRRLRRFDKAVKAYLSAGNKKSIGRHLDLEKGPGHQRGRRNPGMSLDLAREISEQRETKSETRKTRQGKPARTRWKEIGRDHGISDQAVRKRLKRALPYLAEEDAKEFVARLVQHLKQKPPQVGKAKARSADMGKTIRALNRRKR